jgi:hypothetical protein
VQIRRILAATTLILLVASAIYGFIHERLFDQPVWTQDGWARFLGYATVFWAAAAAIIAFRPKWLPAVAAVFVVGYSAWWCGAVFQIVAPFAALYFLASSFLLGKVLAPGSAGLTSLVAGLAAWILTISIAVHFPINTRLTYALALAIPFLLERRRLADYARDFRLDVSSRTEAAALAALLFVLLAHWLVALKPEVSADGLAMHLAVPMTVADQARWPFNFRLYSWALIPMGGDWSFTAAYLLGGEAAARLFNFALLAVIAAMIRRASLRWLSPAGASLAAALFVSTPLAQLVTGSLLVENVWAAMVVGSALELSRYLETGQAAGLLLTGLLLGSAVSMKLMATVFVLPVAAISILAAARRKHAPRAAWAALIFLVFAAPPYLNAWVKTGNPVFPFANGLFRSPYFETQSSFDVTHFRAPLRWTMPYDLAFRSQRYLEGQNGALGFQYFLLLLPAALLVTRRAPWVPLAVGAASALLLLVVVLPYLRFTYPALALLSIFIAWAAAQVRGGTAAMLALAALNVWFLPASGWYHRDFAFFRPAEANKYLEFGAPQRKLIDHLNRTAPGEAVAFFDGDPIAGLRAPAYSESWHSDRFWKRLRDSPTPEKARALFQELGIKHVIAPLALDDDYPAVRDFLQQWTVPSGVTSGLFGLFEVAAAPHLKPRDNPPAPPGEYDDLDTRIGYTGVWQHDRQFDQASRQSITYSNIPGDTLRFSFIGSGVTYVYTRALNRGMARVSIDGRERALIDLYSQQTQWQAQSAFGGLEQGVHTIEVRIAEQNNANSSGHYVDLDAFVVK